jgi:DNA-binding transcriptional LysR family regulator
MDKYTEIVAFLRSAETRSFTGAARVMKLTPSAVSKLISRLEDRLGVRLFDRRAREVVLTHEGCSYQASAQAVVDAMQDADSVAEALPSQVAGTIRVHTMFTFARYQIAPWLLDFQASHPGLTVELHIGSQFVDLFDQGIDLAIHSGVLPDSSRVATQISRSQWIVCASPGYLRKWGHPATPADLAVPLIHPLLADPLGHPLHLLLGDLQPGQGRQVGPTRGE